MNKNASKVVLAVAALLFIYGLYKLPGWDNSWLTSAQTDWHRIKSLSSTQMLLVAAVLCGFATALRK